MINNKTFLLQLLVALGAALLFLPFLGSVHLFDWDEINFAESAREMLVSGNYLDVQINYTAFWEKPPLFIWFQVASMKLFGVNEFAARFPNAIAGIVTLLVFFNIGVKYFSKRFAFLWVLVYVGSILPFFYFKSGIIDPWFNLFIFLGIYYFYQFTQESVEKPVLKPVILSALFVGLGILTKGPVALLIFLLTAFIYMLWYKKYKLYFNWKVLLSYIVVLSFVGGFWFILQLLNGNYSVIVDFIVYQIRLFQIEDAGHGGFFAYHFVVLFFGVFPGSIFAIKAFNRKKQGDDNQHALRQWMFILFWVVLILFSIVNTKIVHYSSMCYFPLSFLAAHTIYQFYENKERITLWMKICLSFISIILGGVIAGFYFVDQGKQRIIESGAIKDDFAVGNLQAQADWSVFTIIIGLVLIIGTLYTVWFVKKDTVKAIGLFFVSLFFVFFTMSSVVPNIEKYSQNAAIEFYKSKADQDCYVETFGFKSYAKFFYFKKPIPVNENSLNEQWWLNGPVDKPVYIVCKNISQERFEKENNNFELIEVKNGFAFYKRTDIP